MSAPDSSAGGTGVLSPLLRLLLPFSMSPPPPPIQHPISPAMRSEKLLRDALLKDERERQQLSSPATPPTHRRRHSHVPTPSYSGEDYTRGSFLFRTAMSNPRSPSPALSSFSQGKELERDRDNSPVRRMLVYGGDVEGHNSPNDRRQSQPHSQQQQSTTAHHYYTRRASPSPAPSGRSSTSTSPSPSPLHMKRRQENLNPTASRHGSTHPSRPGQGEPLQMTPHEQVLRTRLEKALTTGGSSDGRMSRGDLNEVRDEQGGWPWGRGRQSTGGSGGGSMVSSFITTSSSTSNSSQSHLHSNYPQTPYTTNNNQRTPYYSPSSPHSPLSVPRALAPTSYSPAHTRTRSQTDPNPHPPRQNNTLPPASPPVAVRSNSKPPSAKKSTPPSPLLLGQGEEDLRLPTPPPTPPSIARVYAAGGDAYVPSPYKSAATNPNPSQGGTPTKIPVRIQTQNAQRKKEGGLEMRRPTQRPEEKKPLRPLDLSSSSSRELAGKKQRDITITQQSIQAQLPTTNPKKSSNADGHSLASTGSRSTRTSISSASHPHSHAECVPDSGYCACSSHSSLDGLAGAPQPRFVGDIYAQSDSTTKTFNARKASNTCRAIQGYVSFASVEGLGEPPLVGDEFDGDGFGDGDGGKGGKGAFSQLGMWSAALGWKKFLGGGSGVEGQQGVVV